MYYIIKNGNFKISHETFDGAIEFDPLNEPDELKNLIEIQNNLTKEIKELTTFLNETQFKFGDDYDLKGTPEWEELKIKRQQAREFVRRNK